VLVGDLCKSALFARRALTAEIPPTSEDANDAHLAVLLLLGSTGHNAAKFSDEWMNALGDITPAIGLVVLLPLWLVLRAFDIAFISYRRNRAHQYPLSANAAR
jgi:hypothetical protein